MSSFFKVLFLILLCLKAIDFKAQIEFQDLQLEEALQLSIEQSKPIFVDVYTRWCGPCKKMDATTFQDAEVGQYMNEHFINIKWEADHYKYAKLARSYGVNSYPTLMFLDAGGNVIMKNKGLHTKSMLLDYSESLLEFVSVDYTATLERLQNNGHPLKSELLTSLKQFENFYFEEKEQIYNMLYSIYKAEDNGVLIRDFGVVTDNIYNEEQLEFAINNYPTEQDHYDQAHKGSPSFRYRIKTKIEYFFDKALEEKNRSLIEKIAELNLRFDQTLNPNRKIQRAEFDNRVKLLEFYKRYWMTDAYGSLARAMVKVDLDPYTPKMMFRRDSARLAIANKVNDNRNYRKKRPRVKMMDDEKLAFRMALKYQIVADNFAVFYDDSESLELALTWAQRSSEYVDLPENRLSQAKILTKLGYKDEANMHIIKALASPYINDQVKTM